MEKKHLLQMKLNSVEHEHNEETKNTTGIQCIIAAMKFSWQATMSEVFVGILL